MRPIRDDPLPWVHPSSSFSNSNCLEAAWDKSAECTDDDCVHVAVHEGNVLVRDSKDPDGPVLRFTPAEWEAFVEGAKKGEFDRHGLQLRAAGH